MQVQDVRRGIYNFKSIIPAREGVIYNSRDIIDGRQGGRSIILGGLYMRERGNSGIIDR
jgi:hypothetical protein